MSAFIAGRLASITQAPLPEPTAAEIAREAEQEAAAGGSGEVLGEVDEDDDDDTVEEGEDEEDEDNEEGGEDGEKYQAMLKDVEDKAKMLEQPNNSN